MSLVNKPSRAIQLLRISTHNAKMVCIMLFRDGLAISYNRENGDCTLGYTYTIGFGLIKTHTTAILH